MLGFSKREIGQRFVRLFLTEKWIRAGEISRVFLFAAAAMFVLSGSWRITQAADGDLDPTFGDGGKVVTDFNGFGDVLIEIVLQTDGKIIAVGYTHSSSGSVPHIALARYKTDGSIDTTFGNGGRVITQITSNDVGDTVAVQPDGKILVGGRANTPSTVDSSFALLRYNPNGTLDPTFGSGGIVFTNIGESLDGITAIALQTDGKIVVSGFRAFVRPPGEQRNGDIVVARYNSNGSLDTTFGSGGKTLSDFGPVSEYFADDATSINIQPDGKIVVGGDSDGGGYFDFLVARYNANGLLDTTFGNGGFVKTDLGNGYEDGSADVAIQSDGKIVSVGSALPDSYDLDFALIRYNTNGSLDQTFGTGGKVVFGLQSLTDEELMSVAIQADGKIVALGDSNSSNVTAGGGFLLLRFNTNGTLDPTFGTGGIVQTPLATRSKARLSLFNPTRRSWQPDSLLYIKTAISCWHDI